MADIVKLAGISYRNWGLALFFLSSGLVLWILARQVWKRQNLKLSTVFLVATLIPLLFFYRNTQMHKRYVHPAVLFSAIYAFLSGNYSLYVLVSAAYLLNMEKLLQHLQFKNYQTLIFDPVLFLCCFSRLLSQAFTFSVRNITLKSSNSFAKPLRFVS